jgi:flagellar hook-length control protein FliK
VADEDRQPQRPREDSRGGSENSQDAQRDSQALLSRIEIRPVAPAAPAASSFAMPVQPQDNTGHVSSPTPLIRQALQQVEQGALTRLANGGQRLELALAPSELGAVTLILTSAKSGEISAVIRSERTETAELMARHLDMIRVGLEEQGIKVDKLEVRHEMPNRQDDWQGTEQHNAMREQQERRDHLERLRRLGRNGGQAGPQAREMQTGVHTAEISGQGLHLVA